MSQQPLYLVVTFFLWAVPLYLGLHHIFVPKVGKYRDLGLFEGDATDSGPSTDPVERAVSRIYGALLVFVSLFFFVAWIGGITRHFG